MYFYFSSILFKHFRFLALFSTLIRKFFIKSPNFPVLTFTIFITKIKLNDLNNTTSLTLYG